MTRLLSTVAFLVSIPVVVHPQAAIPEKDIVAAINAYFDAFSRLDADAMAAVETDDYVFIQDGTIVDKEQQIAGIREARNKLGTSAPPARKYAVDVHRILRAGERFIVTGTNTYTGVEGTYKAAFTEIWLQQGGRWRLQHGHYSLPQPSTTQKPTN
jgi:ketosteroid isomerase-like protein